MSKDKIIEAIEEAASYLDNEVHAEVNYATYGGMHELLSNIHSAVDEAFDAQWSTQAPTEEGHYMFLGLINDFTLGQGQTQIMTAVEICHGEDGEPEAYTIGTDSVLKLDDFNGRWWFIPLSKGVTDDCTRDMQQLRQGM